MYKANHPGYHDTYSSLRALIIILVVLVFGCYMWYYIMNTHNLFGDSTNSEPDNELFIDGVLVHEDILDQLKSRYDKNEVRRKRVADEAGDEYYGPSSTAYTTTTHTPDVGSSSHSTATTTSTQDVVVSQTASTVNTPTSFTQIRQSFTTTVDGSPMQDKTIETEAPIVIDDISDTGTPTPSTPSTPRSTDHPQGASPPSPTGKSRHGGSPPSSSGNSRDSQTPDNTPLTEPSSTWKPNPTVYTSPHIQKIAEEFLNSVTWHTTSDAGEMPKTSTPSTTSSPQQGAKSEGTTKSTDTTDDAQTKPLYTSYNIPSTRALPPPCFREAFKINRVCKLNQQQKAVKGENVTLEDIAQMIFVKSTLKLLTDECRPSEWCLELESGIHQIIDTYTYFCDMQSCLPNIPDECLNEERKLILSTLFLMCRVRTENLTDSCLTSVSKMTHVAMTDIYRTRFRRHQSVCLTPNEKELCSGSCYNNAQNLYCMSKLCDTTTDTFDEFNEWTWFFEKNNTALQKCNITTNSCAIFEVHVEQDYWWMSIWETVQGVDLMEQLDYRVLIGIITSLLVIMAGLALVVWACMKKSKLPATYGRSRVQYSELKDEEFDSDSWDTWELDRVS